MSIKESLTKNNFLDFSDRFGNQIFAVQSLKNDKELSFDKNLNSVLESVNLIKEDIAYANQIHSDIIKWVDKPGLIDNTDGLLTTKDIPLCIQTADCVPAFIFDNKRQFYGLVHSGWRGTLKKIIPKAVKELVNKGSNIYNVIVVLGAAIKECCYEVDKDFIKQFDTLSIFKKNNKFYFSNSKQIELDLINIGLNFNQIIISNECTYENKKLCSYRRDRGKAGRMISIIKRK